MEDFKSQVLAAFRLIFMPVARILLRAGINWREFAELAKATFVEVATADFGIRGRPTNISRVAILTGLTRREVRRLRNLLTTSDSDVFDRMNRATRVLSGWHTDADFRAARNRPKPLAVSGKGTTFESLCKRYAGDVAPSTMLKELRHVGAVVKDSDGKLIAKTRYYMPVQMDAEQILSSGSVLQDLGNTVAHNLYRKSDEPARFERRATNTRIPPEAVPLFREFLQQEGQAFLERVDEWLTEHELDNEHAGEAIRLGLGAYWIEQR